MFDTVLHKINTFLKKAFWLGYLLFTPHILFNQIPISLCCSKSFMDWRFKFKIDLAHNQSVNAGMSSIHVILQSNCSVNHLIWQRHDRAVGWSSVWLVHLKKFTCSWLTIHSWSRLTIHSWSQSLQETKIEKPYLSRWIDLLMRHIQVG